MQPLSLSSGRKEQRRLSGSGGSQRRREGGELVINQRPRRLPPAQLWPGSWLERLAQRQQRRSALPAAAACPRSAPCSLGIAP
mmetsp:Transcript_43226/g.81148  ORF Transcript_43226/g.81148 Transcript_43226/m.81148 type:complete len:83 (-) Transcript_43226:2032-2280(-)